MIVFIFLLKVNLILFYKQCYIYTAKLITRIIILQKNNCKKAESSGCVFRYRFNLIQYYKITQEALKGIYLSKALNCMIFSCINKNAFYQGDGYPLATLLYEYFIHLT